MEASGLLSGLAPLQPEGARGVSPGADPGPSVLSRSSESGRGWRVPLALRVAPRRPWVPPPAECGACGAALCPRPQPCPRV